MYHAQFELTSTLNIFPVNKRLKLGCGLSPTLFAIYINDLATEINALNCGIKYEDNEISLLMYDDDIVLISGSAAELLNMLNTLNNMCNRWRLAVNK